MKWNIDINQYSDIYIKISKNTKVDKTEFLKSKNWKYDCGELW